MTVARGVELKDAVSMPQSLFLSLDGLDGTGKSTQCRLLAEWLRGQGYQVLVCTDPGGTETGKILRTLLLEQKNAINLPCEALLFMASRAQLVGEIIRPALAKGTLVICDRFLLANVVYQGHAGGLDPELLWRIGMMATHGLEPELTLVLDLPPEVAGTRLSDRGRLETGLWNINAACVKDFEAKRLLIQPHASARRQRVDPTGAGCRSRKLCRIYGSTK